MYVCIYIYIYIYMILIIYHTAADSAGSKAAPKMLKSLYHCIARVMKLLYFLFDSESLPLGCGCSGGEGTPPETLKCLTPNPCS